MKLRLALDVGGTFTDVVLDCDGARLTANVPTTPTAPDDGIFDGVKKVLRSAGRSIAEVASLIHGTTLATNALLERRGARTALITTDGFRDSIEIGTESRYDQYDLSAPRTPPLLDRSNRFTVRERIDARGNVVVPLDYAQLGTLVNQLKERDIESVAICFLHSYANGSHEYETARFLSSALSGVPLSLSCEVCPEIREYERATTTVANAYVRPLMEQYLLRMQERLVQAGFRGNLMLMSSSGGLTSVELACQFPIRLVESGPAGGVIFASRVAEQQEQTQAIALDMGGTTAKICLITDGQVQMSRSFEFDRAAKFMKGSGIPIRVPAIELVEIGSGGGSIAAIDPLGRLRVGPESSSAVPGPACYKKGGRHPTVTDANLLLGLLDKDHFVGGAMPLSPDLAKDAFEAAFLQTLHLEAVAAAYAVYEVVCESMANAIKMHAAERGINTANGCLVISGGAAALHACRIAEKLNVGAIIVPPDAGVGSAVGFLTAPISFEQVRTRYMRVNSAFQAVNMVDLLESMRTSVVAASRIPSSEQVLSRIGYMRYVGQGHEIPVEIEAADLCEDAAVLITDRFNRTYQRLYGRTIPNAEIEIIAWSVRVSEAVSKSRYDLQPITPSAPEPDSFLEHYDGMRNSFVQLPVYQRTHLRHGAVIIGPAIIAEEQTSSFVMTSFEARIDGAGNILMERKKG